MDRRTCVTIEHRHAFGAIDRLEEEVAESNDNLQHAQVPAVLDHSCALPQCDGGAGPAFARGAVRCECNLVVLDASDVFDDAFTVRCPSIDAESEVRSDFHAIALTSSLPS